MVNEGDWRIVFVEDLRGVKLRFQKYTRWSETWDHDHCAACGAKFAEHEGLDILQEGYATCEDYPSGAQYEWVCKTCFHELQPVLYWYDENGGKFPN